MRRCVHLTTVPPDDRRTRRILAALVSDDPDRDAGWADEFTVRRRAGLPAVTTFQILEQLRASGAVEHRVLLDTEAPTPRGGTLVHYRLTGTGAARSVYAARHPFTQLTMWWHRRSSAAAARLARERF